MVSEEMTNVQLIRTLRKSERQVCALLDRVRVQIRNLEHRLFEQDDNRVTMNEVADAQQISDRISPLVLK